MNNKKRILIFCYWFGIGGGERALVDFLKIIPKENYDITLMSFNKNFALLEYIPKYIKIILPPFKIGMDASVGIKNLIKKKIKHKQYFIVLSLILGLLFNKLFMLPFLLKYMLFEKQNVKYDYIFNWSGFSSIGDIICSNVYQSDKKYIWFHLDFFNDKTMIKKYKKILSKYNFVFCVSKSFSEKVKKVYKNIADKIVTLYNPIDTEKILNLSNSDSFNDNYNGCRILSVGRLIYLKGFDIAIKACKILIDKGYDFKWYVVGNGPERKKLMNLIKENNLENNFVLLGEKENPYPFFKDCDIYVQTSRSETYCLTLSEAKILNKPIVTTIFSGTYEQIKDKETGVVVETTPEGIAAGVQQLLDNKELREKLINNLKIENQKPKPDYFSELKKYL